MSKYVCVVCKKKLNSGNIHDHYLGELSRKFAEEGYKIIEEGRIPFRSSGEWQIPDLFILDRRNCLAKIVEVIVGYPYEGKETSSVKPVYVKCRKIRNYYSPHEIVVFEPTDYLDKVRLHETKEDYAKELGYEPSSYKQIQKYYGEKWKKEGLNVIFWNEDNLM